MKKLLFLLAAFAASFTLRAQVFVCGQDINTKADFEVIGLQMVSFDKAGPSMKWNFYVLTPESFGKCGASEFAFNMLTDEKGEAMVFPANQIGAINHLEKKGWGLFLIDKSLEDPGVGLIKKFTLDTKTYYFRRKK